MDKIYIIGDSHVHIFSGENRLIHNSGWLGNLPDFRINNISALAYSFGTEGHRVLKEINRALKDIPIGSHIILMYGEIDCRFHLLKQSFLQERNLPEVVSECVNRYFKSARKIIEDYDCKPIFWGPVPSGPRTYEVEHIGTIDEINEIKRLFNIYLEDLCAMAGIPFITVFFKMIEDGTACLDEYYMDGSHISQMMMPYIINRLSEFGIKK